MLKTLFDVSCTRPQTYFLRAAGATRPANPSQGIFFSNLIVRRAGQTNDADMKKKALSNCAGSALTMD